MIRRLLPNSLSWRLLAMTTLWTAAALLVTGVILSAVFRTNTQRDFERLLQAHTYNLMGAIDVDEAGLLSGSPNLGDPRFLTPLSGWYWSVATAQQPQIPLLHSSSIAGDQLPVPSSEEAPFDEEFRRISHVEDDDGHVIQQLEAQLFVGDNNTLYQVLVAGNTNDIELAVSRFNQTLLLFFSLFGFGMVVATYFVIRVGLRPLSRATDALHDVREGLVDTLDGTFPHEIQPLAAEINELISANSSVVERARIQVGNLAHALKTPLAVILNETRTMGGDKSALIVEQAELMKSQVQTYLDRARISARRKTSASRVSVVPVVEKFIRVMQRLSPDIDFAVEFEDGAIMFRGEEQDLEEILGNLLENAARFARSRVVVEVRQVAEDTGITTQFEIVVADDGPGLSAEDRELALKRGMRLDETQPGSGLGLAIVRDVADEYGGSFKLDSSELGGLSAVIVLPKLSATSRTEMQRDRI